MKHALQEGVKHYKQPKSEQDIDLLQEVRQLMIASGLGLKIPEAFNTNRFIIEAEAKPSDIQRFLLNRYWNQQLMSSPKMSIEERYCLIPDGNIQDWLQLFRDKVLPFVLENDLPIVI